MYSCCDRWFNSARALEQHQLNSASHKHCCHICDMNCTSSTGLEDHYASSHDYCTICGIFFDDTYEVLEHADEEYEHYLCRSCVRIFPSFDALASHHEASHHYCRECNRLFLSASNLAAHRGSSLHTPRTIQCPGRACNKVFVSVSALLLHAESNTCAAGITRKVVNDYVARVDRNNVITNPSRMIAGPGGQYAAPQDPDYWATERSWDGYSYNCFLCTGKFGTLQALNQHLKSPRHYQRIYRCPMKGCGLEFSVLSGLSQHVERGSCGVRDVKAVQDTFDGLTRGMRSIAL